MTGTDMRHARNRSTAWVARRIEEALFMVAGAALAMPLILPFA